MTVWLLLATLAAADAGVPPDAVPAPAIVNTAPSAAEPPARGRAKAEHAQAMSALRAGNATAAAELFGQAAAHDPGNAVYATDWGFALGKLGQRREAESALRGAIERDPRRFYAYVNLADLLATDPGRWEHPDAIVAELEKGLEALREDRKGRFSLTLALAGFERAVGRTAQARARLTPLLEGAAPAAGPTRLQRKRVLDLLEALALDDRARSLEDWPAPAPELARNQVREARGAEAAGRVDDAIRALEIAVNLAPSDAEAWRALGRLLAAHGGALEIDRADDALRNALALEPAWSDLRELRAQLARRRHAASAPAPTPRAPPPSDKARALVQEAEDWIDVGDPIGLGREMLEQALADSPAFVSAALSLYALTGTVPDATVASLHDDGPGLWALATGVRKLGAGGKGARGREGDGSVEGLVRPWIDRAVELDVQEARFARATARAADGDRAGALSDLIAYLAREPQPAHLDEARALRAGLLDDAGDRVHERHLPPQLVARIRLVEDRPEAALRALGGACAPGLPPERLVAIGVVDEYAERRAAARGCYELAGAAGDLNALARLGRLNARLPEGELRGANRALLDRAAAAGSAAALWARARLEMADGRDDAALADTRQALAGAVAAADSWVPEAEAAARQLSEGRRAAEDARRVRRRRGGGAAVLVMAAGLLAISRRRWRGKSVPAALRRRPELFPEVARAIAELRHDVLKHRAGVLGAVADPHAARADVLRAMTEPRPTSVVVAGLYDKIAQAGRGTGVVLKSVEREPTFGPLVDDLRRAERLLARSDAAANAELLAIDARLRGEHADRLAELLEMGPRTRIDAAVLSSWIAGVEAATRRAGVAWTAPGLSLTDLQVDFPVSEHALAAIFANLLRNAQAAVAGQPEARVLVRLDRERDVTGRPMVSLSVGDSAPATLTLETIEARESGRGLAIVRDAVREWRGHLVVRPDVAPVTKTIGACFPT